MSDITKAKRIVFKVGSSTLTHSTGKLNLQRIEKLAQVLSDLKNSGKEVILVSSGAQVAGAAKLGLSSRPNKIEEKQAVAAVGQNELMRVYERFFSFYSHPVAQILITRDVIENSTEKQNVENTLETLLNMGCIPIVNENDTISFDEIEFGDNDTLSAYVAMLSSADSLVILSDIDGLFDSDPHRNQNAKLIPVVSDITDEIMGYAGGAGTSRGTGGLVTKLHAAQISTGAGIPVYIINGADPKKIYSLIEGKQIGTKFKV